MPVYKAKSTIQHNGQEYNAGDEVLDLTEAQANELLAAGVLETPESENEQSAAPAPTPPAPQDEELERGTVDEQVGQAVSQDVADSERLANTPGQPIVNNKPSGIVAKAKAALAGNTPEPSADQIANDPQLK